MIIQKKKNNMIFPTFTAYLIQYIYIHIAWTDAANINSYYNDAITAATDKQNGSLNNKLCIVQHLSSSSNTALKPLHTVFLWSILMKQFDIKIKWMFVVSTKQWLYENIYYMRLKKCIRHL